MTLMKRASSYAYYLRLRVFVRYIVVVDINDNNFIRYFESSEVFSMMIIYNYYIHIL